MQNAYDKSAIKSKSVSVSTLLSTQHNVCKNILFWSNLLKKIKKKRKKERKKETVTYHGESASPSLCVHALSEMFDSFCFQYVLSNGDGDGKNNIGQSSNQPSRIYVGVM